MLTANNYHQLLAEDPEGELGVLCQEVEVIRSRENLLTGDIIIELGIWADGERKQFEVDRAAFLEGRFMTQLMRKGLVISATKENIEALTDYLIEAAERAPTEYFHDKLGFTTRGKTTFYLTDTAAGSSKESHFHDPKLTRPKGSLDEWENMVHEDVMGHTPLELALGISFSAPISHILQEEGLCAEVPIWAIISKSSTGKTTALRLMASVYGSPEEGTGFLQDFNATENAFFRQLSNGMGVPHIIDEATGNIPACVRQELVYVAFRLAFVAVLCAKVLLIADTGGIAALQQTIWLLLCLPVQRKEVQIDPLIGLSVRFKANGGFAVFAYIDTTHNNLDPLSLESVQHFRAGYGCHTAGLARTMAVKYTEGLSAAALGVGGQIIPTGFQTSDLLRHTGGVVAVGRNLQHLCPVWGGIVLRNRYAGSCGSPTVQGSGAFKGWILDFCILHFHHFLGQCHIVQVDSIVSVVFPALTQAQLTQLHEEINTVCTDLRNLFHKMERMAQT